MLQSRSMVDEARLPRNPRPASVGRGVICWPGGQSLPEGSETVGVGCQTWLLEGSEPPTLLLPEQEGIRGIRFPVWLDKEGKRVAADCPDATEKCWMSGRCRWSPGCLLPKNGLLVSPPVQQFALRWITIMRRR